MANLFANLIDKNNPAKKIQREIENTEFKKQSLIAPLQNDINAALQKIDQALYQIGKEVYEAHLGGTQADEGLTAYFEQIASQKAFVQEREAKIKVFAERYDEELAILRSNLDAPVQPAPRGTPQAGADTPGAFCGNCGKPYTPGEDFFCESCGQKLENNRQ